MIKASSCLFVFSQLDLFDKSISKTSTLTCSHLHSIPSLSSLSVDILSKTLVIITICQKPKQAIMHSMMNSSSSSLQLKPPSVHDISLNLSLSTSPPPLQSLKAEERGIHIINLLLTCVTHVSSGNLHRADACLHRISQLSSINGENSIQRLAARFASALAVRLVKRWPGLYKALNPNEPGLFEPDRTTRFPFPQTTTTLPSLALVYDIMNRTLVRAMINEQVIHIVDLGSSDPNLWVPLLRAISKAPSGPPHIKLTCISRYSHMLESLSPKLVKEADLLDIPFQFNPLNTDLKNLTVDMITIRSGEALAVTSVLSLHKLLAEDDCIDVHFGNINNTKASPQMKCFLAMVRSMSPNILLLVEQESNDNLASITDRFVEGLHYYSAMFDSFEANSGCLLAEERLGLDEMFGREIMNIVACEGKEREMRHERYVKWMVRFGKSGFKPMRLWYEAMDQDAERLIERYGRDGYNVLSERGALMICWHNRPLYAVSAWCSW